jgi:hypothetical protein
MLQPDEDIDMIAMLLIPLSSMFYKSYVLL